MNAKQLPATLAVAAILTTLTLGPWYLGQRAEVAYRDGLANLARQPQGPRVVAETYRRGWFSSQADLELATGSEDQGGEVRLSIASHIGHGPRTLADLTWPPTLARVASTLGLEHPAVQLGGVQADTRIGWDGDTLTHIALPAIDQPATAETAGVRTAAGSAEVRLDTTTGKGTGTLDLPSLEVLGDGDVPVLSLHGLHATNATDPWLPGLALASADLSVAEVRVVGQGGGVEARDLGLSVRSHPDAGLLGFKLVYSAGVLRVEGADYAPSQVEISVDRLDGATLVALQQDIADLAERQIPEAMAGIARLAVVLRHLPALAAADPQVALDRLDITTPQGPVTGRLTLGVQGLTGDDLSGRGAWLRRLAADGELSLPRPVALALLVAAQRRQALEAAGEAGLSPDQDQALGEAAAMQLEGLLKEGWVGAEGERLRTSIKLADGLLTVNGKTLPIGGALPL